MFPVKIHNYTITYVSSLLVTTVALLLFVPVTAHAQTMEFETHYIVKQIDYLGDESVVIMSQEDYEVLRKRIQMESIHKMRAHKVAEAKWDNDGNTGKYPGRGLSRRSAIKLSTCNSLETAVERIDAIQKSSKLAQDKKQWSRDRLADALQVAHDNWRYGRNTHVNPIVIQTAQHRARSDKKREEVRKRLEQAVGYYKEALDELIDGGVASSYQ